MENNQRLNLLGNLARVEVPFIKVTIGECTFGIYDKSSGNAGLAKEAYRINGVKYPNYVKSLQVQKINGEVNQYTLELLYQITPESDPNFFEKVFSSVSQTRKISFTYGDISMPSFIYKDEEAIITDIKTNFISASSQIKYTIYATSASSKLGAGSFTFKAKKAQPSEVLLGLFNEKKYGLQDIFYGMRDLALVKQKELIARDDKIVDISMKTNISLFDYITYLVSCMTPASDTKEQLSKSGVYVLNVVDDVSGDLNGPYFTVKKLTSAYQEQTYGLSTYNVDIGYPSNNIVTNFSIDDNQNYSIFYDYTNSITQEQYSYRINNEGKLEPIYAPLLSSKNQKYKTTEADRSWWTNVTNFPITATLELKGLLRPSLLMSYINLNMYYYGKKHISSGLYSITKQIDTVNEYGFKTQLSLIRLSGGGGDYGKANSFDDYVIEG